MGFYEEGIERIYREDFDSQKIFLTDIATRIRNIPVEELYKRKMFYIPNDEYLIYFFGIEALDKRYDLYFNSSTCKFYKRLIMPITNFNGSVAGFCGYDDGSEYGDSNFIKYLYQTYAAFHKDRYFYVTVAEYAKAIMDGYIFIVDGMFDQVRLSMNGYNAVSIMSSNFTKYHKKFLECIPNKIVIPDNDDAGLELYRKLLKPFPKTTCLMQNEVKDIDIFLRSLENQKRFSEVFQYMQKTGFKLSANLALKEGEIGAKKDFIFIK